MLERYAWPGNVRELRNVVERMAILTPGDRITVGVDSARDPAAAVAAAGRRPAGGSRRRRARAHPSGARPDGLERLGRRAAAGHRADQPAQAPPRARPEAVLGFRPCKQLFAPPARCSWSCLSCRSLPAVSRRPPRPGRTIPSSRPTTFSGNRCDPARRSRSFPEIPARKDRRSCCDSGIAARPASRPIGIQPTSTLRSSAERSGSAWGKAATRVRRRRSGRVRMRLSPRRCRIMRGPTATR